jgi:copper chaperone CopZ
MPLSLAKLESLLTTKGFVVINYFELDGSCFYILLFAVKTADVFLMYIPSKYTFPITNETNSYNIKYIDIDNCDNVADEYAVKQDDVDIENIYGNTNIELSLEKKNMEEELENNYKRPIAIRDVSENDTVTLKAINRQLRRFKYCVQNLKYKLAIIYKNYICAIRRDDSIDFFGIKNYPRQPSKKLMIITDLETFYESSDNIPDDIQTVRESIYRLLEKNQGTQTRIISTIMENRKHLLTLPKELEKKKEQYDRMTRELFVMLETMTEAENKINEELENINIKYKDPNLQNDITKAHERDKLEKELDRINSIKSEIGKNILALREKRETKILSTDKLAFDNAVMLDVILKNFSKLKTILLE